MRMVSKYVLGHTWTMPKERRRVLSGKARAHPLWCLTFYASFLWVGHLNETDNGYTSVSALEGIQFWRGFQKLKSDK